MFIFCPNCVGDILDIQDPPDDYQLNETGDPSVTERFITNQRTHAPRSHQIMPSLEGNECSLNRQTQEQYVASKPVYPAIPKTLIQMITSLDRIESTVWVDNSGNVLRVLHVNVTPSLVNYNLGHMRLLRTGAEPPG